MAQSCDRCRKAIKYKYEGEPDQISIGTLRLQEIQTNFGFISTLCVDCRKAWAKWLNSSPTMRKYAEHALRLEHWRAAHRRTGKGHIDEGLAIVRSLNDLEEVLYTEATVWTETSAPKRLPDQEWDEQDEQDERDGGDSYDA